MSLKIFLPMGEKPPDEFGRGHNTSRYHHSTPFPVYLLQLLHEEELPTIVSTPSSTTYSFIVILAGNNATTTTIPAYKGTVHHRLTVIIWIGTGHPPSFLICDNTLLGASKPCLPTHVNWLTNNATTCSIVPMFIVIIWNTGLPSPVAIPLASTNATKAAAAAATTTTTLVGQTPHHHSDLLGNLHYPPR
jgi:hypothetical protein